MLDLDLILLSLAVPVVFFGALRELQKWYYKKTLPKKKAYLFYTKYLFLVLRKQNGVKNIKGWKKIISLFWLFWCEFYVWKKITKYQSENIWLLCGFTKSQNKVIRCRTQRRILQTCHHVRVRSRRISRNKWDYLTSFPRENPVLQPQSCRHLTHRGSVVQFVQSRRIFLQNSSGRPSNDGDRFLLRLRSTPSCRYEIYQFC